MSDFDDAMRTPRHSFCMPDPQDELKGGHVELVEFNPGQPSAFTTPWSVPGGYAVVYKFRAKSGKKRALRVFTRDLTKDLPELNTRYTKLAPYLKQRLSAYSVEFRYHNPGLRLNGQGRPVRLFPLIEMDWVDGTTLIERVHTLCREGSQPGLSDLIQQWHDLFLALRQARMAHGDLAATNVLVRDDGRLVLVDYDGCFIPEFAGCRALVAGQRNFQHKDFDNATRRPFGLYWDDFSWQAIYAALLAVRADPQVWLTSGQVDPATNRVLDEDRFLFEHSDFKTPDSSQRIQKLRAIPDPELQRALDVLVDFCRRDIETVRLPDPALPPGSPVSPPPADAGRLAKLLAALENSDDDSLRRLWRDDLYPYLDSGSRERMRDALRRAFDGRRMIRPAGLHAGLSRPDAERLRVRWNWREGMDLCWVEVADGYYPDRRGGHGQGRTDSVLLSRHLYERLGGCEFRFADGFPHVCIWPAFAFGGATVLAARPWRARLATVAACLKHDLLRRQWRLELCSRSGPLDLPPLRLAVARPAGRDVLLETGPLRLESPQSVPLSHPPPPGRLRRHQCDLSAAHARGAAWLDIQLETLD